MPRMIDCQYLRRPAEGLDSPPHPGELGQRVYRDISKEAWRQWLERLAAILNENRLSTAELGSIEVIERHMRGFLFGEGDLGQLPAGFMPKGK
ncbi:MAG: oxidative damage protection protein [Gammaproteobacteria bacterium]